MRRARNVMSVSKMSSLLRSARNFRNFSKGTVPHAFHFLADGLVELYNVISAGTVSTV